MKYKFKTKLFEACQQINNIQRLCFHIRTFVFSYMQVFIFLYFYIHQYT